MADERRTESRPRGRIRRVVRTASMLCLLLPLGANPTRADTGRAPRPKKTADQNFSDLHDKTEWVQVAFAKAEAAAKVEDWPTVVRRLQSVIEQIGDRENENEANPAVRAVRGQTVYEGAWLVAHHAYSRFGAPCAEALESEFGITAQESFDTALRRSDLDGLGKLARRFLTMPVGRRAALLLADLALERGDRDEALEWLELLEDLEATCSSPVASWAHWRDARISRHAAALSTPATRSQVNAALHERAKQRDAADNGLSAIPFAHRGLTTTPTHWPTTGGNTERNAVPAALGHRFKLKWFVSPTNRGDLADSVDPRDGGANRPSTWLPPRAISMPAGLFVSDGTQLIAYAPDTGTRLAKRHYRHSLDLGFDVDDDRRTRFGWLEGHCLTGHVDTDGQTWIYAAVPDGRAFEPTRANETPRLRDDRIEALTFDGVRITSQWVAGGRRTTPGMPEGIRLYGAPAYYRGRLWVAGIRSSGKSSDRWEAWMFSLSPKTGAVLSRTHVGTGTPVRPVRQDEVIPTSPAASRGRVVFGTSLGIVAAVDARDGRLRWAFRNDRDIKSARRMRGRSNREVDPRGSSFANEPPILRGERCYVDPIDGLKLYQLYNRPMGPNRQLVSFHLDQRESFTRFEAELLAGVVMHPKDGVPVMIITGQGQDKTPSGPVVYARDAWPPAQRWYSSTSTGLGNSTFGRALVTQAEVFVPTHGGIEIYDVATGEELALLNLDTVPKASREHLPKGYGNLIPVPGKGILAVSATSITFWERTK